MRKTKYWILAGMSIFLLAVGCKLVTDDEGSDLGIRSFKLAANEVSGWTETSYFEYNVSNCSDNAGLNGGAAKYVEKGLVEGIKQRLMKSDYNADIFIMDFGNSSNATDMFDNMSAGIDPKQPVGDFGMAIAVLDEHLSGVNVYAHFNKYFFEIHFTGYSNKADAKTTAASFIELYENKVINLN